LASELAAQPRQEVQRVRASKTAKGDTLLAFTAVKGTLDEVVGTTESMSGTTLILIAVLLRLAGPLLVSVLRMVGSAARLPLTLRHIYRDRAARVRTTRTERPGHERRWSAPVFEDS
jgi:hypothetical protein